MSHALGRLVRTRRIEMGITQEQFADLLGEGVRQSDVSRLELGRVSTPRRDRLQRISDILDLPFGELLLKTSWAEAHSEGVASDATNIDASPVVHRSSDDVLKRARTTTERTQRTRSSTEGTAQIAHGANN